MRLISWDGKRDVSYENCHLVINPRTFEIEAITGNPIFEPVMGIYSTEAKSLKVMEMLRNAYAGKVIFQNVTIGEDVLELMNKWKMQAIISKTDSEPRIEYINNNIFVFPKDEEVEVQEWLD